jgi:alkaline phosphatase
MMRMMLMAALLAATAPALAAPVLDTPVKDNWWQGGRAALDARLKVVNRPKRAKNVILMVGDGMGIATITAARIFDGQRPMDGRPPAPGEENVLAWDGMANTALVKTYNSNAQVADSAGTASAMNRAFRPLSTIRGIAGAVDDVRLLRRGVGAVREAGGIPLVPCLIPDQVRPVHDDDIHDMQEQRAAEQQEAEGAC